MFLKRMEIFDQLFFFECFFSSIRENLPHKNANLKGRILMNIHLKKRRDICLLLKSWEENYDYLLV
jgi:hypothetical protein